MTQKAKDILLAVVTLAACSTVLFFAQRIHTSRTGVNLLLQENRALSERIAQTALATRKADAERNRLEEAVSDLDLQSVSPKISQTIQSLEKAFLFKSARNELDGDYAGLFRKLHLNPARLNALRDLLADRLQAENEARRLAMADELMLDDLPDREAIVTAGTDEVDERIEQLLDEKETAIFLDYRDTARTRKWLLKPFAQHLDSQPAALSEAQLDQLAASVPRFYLGTGTFLMTQPAPPFPEALKQTARQVLNAIQLAAFEQYEQVWDAQREKAQMEQEYNARQSKR